MTELLVLSSLMEAASILQHVSPVVEGPDVRVDIPPQTTSYFDYGTMRSAVPPR
jgi:hypothetical protein